ncbi:hypothetical protein ACFU51_07415 [Streptomyces sp. NPDC057430]|uniref:hypothetical protein n=1 Tax=Streptomyces sp. NPDC057430 TaxID=3346131 RepID=UPI003690D0A9
MPTMPTLVALIGPVEPELLESWLHHYRTLGIERFTLGFHYPDHVTEDVKDLLGDVCRREGITPALVSCGPWHEHTNPQLTAELRGIAGDGWHLIADSDEFHTYPAPLTDVLCDAERHGTQTMGGLMLDRVSADGTLTGWDPAAGLDAGFPLGAFLTHHLLRGDPRKVVLAHSGIALSSGNHRAPGHRPTNRPPVVIHHFKWRSGIREDLTRRYQHSLDGSWQTDSPAIPTEARRLLDHLDQHNGRIDVHDQDLSFRPVSLLRTPSWWAEEATSIVETWRPPANNHSQSGPTISSPSP